MPACRSFGRRTCCGNDSSPCEDQHEAEALIARAKQAQWQHQQCNRNGDPCEPAKSRQQARDEKEIGFRDKWQPGSPIACRLC